MTETIVEFLIGALVLLGAFFCLVAALGLMRMPDLFTRTHAASKASTLGVMLTLLGVLAFFWYEDGYINARLVLGIIFVFITTPVAGHIISRAAYNMNVPLWEKTVQDDLKNSYSKSKDV
ncbi:monovalent cation/H(+) antiporter subunit G [Bacillus sp. Marseille-P3661]|uniref:monovalent cation/H(+) antiporter subunit G n=1 Tax=Bacillus sp. Marseille-P3661 TaxID=1936234 RepID=UPI000C8338E5|nr:monovalent cation/H(+) antiporter subunit G [Bacillus sp. Marseille-P3661]